MTTTLGFVGLGHMGGNMAARFLAALLTRASELGHKHHDIAALYDVLAE